MTEKLNSKIYSGGFRSKFALEPGLTMSDRLKSQETIFAFSDTDERPRLTAPLFTSVSGLQGLRSLNLISNPNISAGSSDVTDCSSDHESNMTIDHQELVRDTVPSLKIVNGTHDHSIGISDASNLATDVKLNPHRPKMLSFNAEECSINGENYSGSELDGQENFRGPNLSTIESDIPMSDNFTTNIPGSVNSDWTMAACTATCAEYQKSLEDKIEYLTRINDFLLRDIKERDVEIETKLSNITGMEFELDEAKSEIAVLKCDLDACKLFTDGTNKAQKTRAKKIVKLSARIKKLKREVDLRKQREKAGAAGFSSAIVKDLKDRLTKAEDALEHALACNSKHLDDIKDLNAALENEEERRKDLESHIVVMGRCTDHLKEQNRVIQLDIKLLNSMEADYIHEINDLTAKVKTQELEIKELQDLYLGSMRLTTARDIERAGQLTADNGVKYDT